VVQVEVELVNSGVGHSVPGGMANSALVLAVGVEDAAGKLHHRSERVYRRTLVDGEGRELTAVADLFLKAESVSRDTGLRPGDSRLEYFTLPLPDGARGRGAGRVPRPRRPRRPPW
jgi:hypothetical protein